MISIILKNKRTLLDLKIQEITSISGIDQALLSKYESGNRNPSDSHLLTFSKAYQLASQVNMNRLHFLKQRLLMTFYRAIFLIRNDINQNLFPL